MKTRPSVLILLLAGCLPAPDEDPAGAFPGAQGFGTSTPGGRGGRIVFVTSLADSGPGSLREAMLTDEPRTVLFRVSGVIALTAPIMMGGPSRSHITIDGRSAPGGGIAITGNTVYIHNGVHDVVLRHLRFRAAGEGPSVHGGAHHVVIDHCSFSWAYDENLDLFDDATDITVSWCIFAEGLRNGGHPDGPHSMGVLVGKGADRISFHHNFLSGNDQRNVLWMGSNVPQWRNDHAVFPAFDMRNNLVYNCPANTAVLGGAQVSAVGNVFVPGPDTIPHMPEIGMPIVNDATITTLGTGIYVEDNAGPHIPAGGDPWLAVYDEVTQTRGPQPGLYRRFLPVDAPRIWTHRSGEVPGVVTAGAGARPHDATDERLVAEFFAGTGSSGAPARTPATPFPPPAAGIPAPDGDDDGMADAWEVEHGLDPADAADAIQDGDFDGFSNLEEFLDGTPPVRHLPRLR